MHQVYFRTKRRRLTRWRLLSDLGGMASRRLGRTLEVMMGVTRKVAWKPQGLGGQEGLRVQGSQAPQAIHRLRKVVLVTDVSCRAEVFTVGIWLTGVTSNSGGVG